MKTATMELSKFKFVTLEPPQRYRSAQTHRNVAQPIWATQMAAQESAVVTGRPQAVNNGMTLSNGINKPENNTTVNFLQDVFDLERGLREPLNRTSCVVPQTMSRDCPSDKDFTRWESNFLDYVQDATWFNNQALTFNKGATDYQVVPDKPPRKLKRNRRPKPKMLYDGKGPIQLWQLILSLLISSSPERLVEWTKERKYEFRILQPDKLATLWGEQKKKPLMTFEKLARGLRYYYGKSILEKVRGKQHTYQFVMDIAAILGFDPMRQIPEGARRIEGYTFSETTTSQHTAVNQGDTLDVPEYAGPEGRFRSSLVGYSASRNKVFTLSGATTDPPASIPRQDMLLEPGSLRSGEGFRSPVVGYSASRNELFTLSGTTHGQPTVVPRQDMLHVPGCVEPGERFRGSMPEGYRGTGDVFWGGGEGEGFVDVMEGLEDTGESFDGTREEIRVTMNGIRASMPEGYRGTGEVFWGSGRGEGFVDVMEGFADTGENFYGTREEMRVTMEGFSSSMEGYRGAGEVFWGRGRGGGEGLVDVMEGLGDTGERFKGTREGIGRTMEGSEDTLEDITQGFWGGEEQCSATREGFLGRRGGYEEMTEGFGGITEGMAKFGDREAGFPCIKLFDFSVLVESNKMSSFYEAS